MTVIQPNSITGINSITVSTGEVLSIHNSSGDLIHTLTSSSGVATYKGLHVGSGTTTSNQGLNVGTGASIVSDAVNTLSLYTNNTERLQIDAGGDINVGTAATIYANGNITAGIVTATEFVVGTAVTIGRTNGNATFAGIVTATSFVGSGANLTGISAVGGASGVDFNDSVKARFGTGNDLEIYHDGADSYIKNATGHLRIYGSDTTDKHIYLQPNNGEDGIKILNDGAVELYHNNTKTCETSANGLAFPNGKGIDFSAHGNDSGATGQSTDSEVLDEYEEGEWDITPNNSNLTFTNPDCRYTKIGNLVTCVGKIEVNTVTGSDLTYLELPFSCAHVNNYGNASGSAMIHTNINAGGDACGMFIPGNTANVWLFGCRDNASWRHISNSHLSSTSEMIFSFSYRTT